MKHNFQKSSILGVNVSNITLEQIVGVLLDFSNEPATKTAFYLNAHCVNVSYSDSEYRHILNNSDLVYSGGQAIIWASRFLGRPLPERVNILDFFNSLVERLKENNTRIYLLGGKERVVKKTEVVLKGRGVNVVGSHHGYLSGKDQQEVVRSIKELRPDILMVGMGVPLQEKWIDRHKLELGVNLCWGVGAAFEWLSGERRRAPRWMIKSGLEWLHRLYQQPARLWRRYLIGNIVFTYHIILSRFKHENYE